ncbi:AAA family ATPase [Phormidium sp. FACHB-1136]|uniref:AAA family ATPase n=1 Tax=Phormidium sp. FACHB-1136 TaxID=2692848 RepID=UPI0018F059C7|nr:AAA family ATPase [Phormidium sp. FACHB-1136]
MSAILSEFILENSKSYRTGLLPLGPLTVLIGANASGKSNALEGLRFLSWLAQGQKLTSIQHTVNAADRIVRGRVEDLCHRGESSFSMGCALQASEWNHLTLALTLRDGDLHISHESITNTENQKLYELDQPSQGVGTDVSVAYNPFDRGQNKPHIACSDQRAIFMQLDSPATFNAKHQQSQQVIAPAGHAEPDRPRFPDPEAWAISVFQYFGII